MEFKDAKTKTGIFSSLITLVVVGLLLFAGPAQAFVVGLGDFTNSNPIEGEIVSTIANVTIDSNERVNIDYMNLTINGDVCLFNAYNGSFISGCEALLPIDVIASPSLDYGYGYGYAYGYDFGYGYNQGYSNGVFSYNISINTSVLGVGNFDVELSAKVGPVFYGSDESRNLNISSSNQAPLAFDGGFTVAEGSSHNGLVIANDIDGDALTYSLVSGPAKGTLTFNVDGLYTYSAHRQPTSGFVDTDTFTFKANDGLEDSNIATVTIAITPVNDAPIANSDSFSVLEGSTHVGQVSATDIDGDILIYSLVSDSAKGRLAFNTDGSYTYQPNIGNIGLDSFTFEANDGLANSNIATVDITITANTTAPTTTIIANYPNGTQYNGEWTTEDIIITLEADDVHALTQYLIDGEDLTNYSAPFIVDEYSVLTYWSSNVGSEVPQNYTIRFPAEGPKEIGGDWEFPDGSSPESADNVTLHGDLNVTIGANSSVLLPAEAVITSSTLGETINLSALTSSMANDSLISGLTGLAGALQFGIPNLGLSFSPAITIRIYVGTDLDNETINVYRSTTGNSGWNQNGLVNTTCVVTAGICEFQTTQASYFATAQSITTTSPSSSSGGGGVCTTEWIVSEWSECVNGVQTRSVSFPANFCTPTTAKPAETQSCTVEGQVPQDDEETIETPNRNTLLTGFVIGEFLSKPTNVVGLLIVLVLIVLAFLFVARKKKATTKKK